MKHLILGLIAAVLMTACGGTSTDAASGDTYNVSVDNNGNGDVTVNTGSGTISTNINGDCVVLTETTLEDGTIEQSERNCTDNEIIKQENALYRG